MDDSGSGRLPLAHLPTPIHPLAGEPGWDGVEVLVKRDDLTGSHLSGNKVRKLEYLLADALKRRASHVITCGGVQSNHCRATALAAAPLGLEPVLLLRTANGLPDDLPAPTTGNVLLNRLAGAELHPCTPAEYEQRDARMAEIAAAFGGARPGGAYIIPEGGSNALGARGYVAAAREIAEQLAATPPTAVVTACGSGGTVAGLAIGFKALGLDVRVVGVAVCHDAPTFGAIIDAISAAATEQFNLPRLDPDDYTIVEGFVGRGYALTTPDELTLLRDTARGRGLVLDPVYTNKAFRGLMHMLEHQPTRLGERVVFLHTGGIFGLMPLGAELEAVL